MNVVKLIGVRQVNNGILNIIRNFQSGGCTITDEECILAVSIQSQGSTASNSSLYISTVDVDRNIIIRNSIRSTYSYASILAAIANFEITSNSINSQISQLYIAENQLISI